MRCTTFRSAAILAAVVSLAGCIDHGPEPSLAPPDYSPHYSKISTVRPDGRTRSVLVPEACLTPDDQSPADLGPERVPPGCANNYNLQQMAARKRDLTRGRSLGAAPAAPAARAAQHYIDGRQGPVLGGGIKPEGGETPTPSTTSTSTSR